MASARAKLRVFLAWVRSATRASMSASERESVATSSGAASLMRPSASAQASAARVMAASLSSRTAKTPSKRSRTLRICVTLSARRVPCVGGGVGGADEIEDGGAGFGGVEVVGEGGGVVVLGLGGGGGDVGVEAFGEAAFQHALVEGAEAVDGVGGFGEAVEGEVHLVAVGDGDEQEADGGGAIAFEQQVAEGVEVALGLGHLLAFDEEEADVHPVAGEGACRRRIRTGRSRSRGAGT